METSQPIHTTERSGCWRLQVFDGDTFKDISYDSRTLLATASVGTVQVVTKGSIVVEVG